MKLQNKILFAMTLSFFAGTALSNLPAQDHLAQDTTAIEKFETGFASGTRFKCDPTQTIQQRMEHYGVPGASIAVVKNNKVIWSEGYGVMDEAARSVARTYNWHNFALPVYEKLAVTEAQIDELSGRYDHSGNLLKVYRGDDGLMLEASGSEPIQLHCVGDNQFACESMEDLFYFSADGLSMKKPWDKKAAPSNIAQRMAEGEKLPVEWVLEGDFEKALAGYQKLKESNPDSPTINEERLNGFGYQLLANDQKKEALSVFRINTMLYPQAFNTFDSLGEIYLMMGEKELGIRNYEKSLELNPENAHAADVLKQAQNAAGK